MSVISVKNIDGQYHEVGNSLAMYNVWAELASKLFLTYILIHSLLKMYLSKPYILNFMFVSLT